MRLVTFDDSGHARAGVLVGDQVVNLQRAEPRLPGDVLGLIQAGPEALERARKAADGARADARNSLNSVRLLAPIPRPPKIVCIGLNYADHAAEAGLAIPARPSTFLKAPSCVIGP